DPPPKLKDQKYDKYTRNRGWQPRGKLVNPKNVEKCRRTPICKWRLFKEECAINCGAYIVAPQDHLASGISVKRLVQIEQSDRAESKEKADEANDSEDDAVLPRFQRVTFRELRCGRF